MQAHRSVVIVGLASLFVLLASCATSSGSAYSNAASSESAAARTNKPSQSEPNPKPPSKPEDGNAHVFIWIDNESVLPNGRLVLENLTAGALVYIDGALYWGTTISLPVGKHQVKVSSFGYEDFEAEVDIFANTDTGLNVSLYPAAFRITSIQVLPSVFDPRDPGHLGSSTIRIEVSAPGEASVIVLDDSGQEVWSLSSLKLTRRSTDAVWDGRDVDGRILGPGEYTVHVEAHDEIATDRSEAKIRLVSNRFSRSAVLHSGVSGALFAPDARCLDAGRLESNAGFLFHLSPEGSIIAGLATAECGVRAGLPLASSSIELDNSVMFVLWPGDPIADSASYSIALKLPLQKPGTRNAAAFFAKATFASFIDEAAGNALPSWDGATRYSGFSVGLPLELGFERSRLFITPELEVSGYYPYWARQPQTWSTPGLFAWGYLRFGIEASVGRSMTLGVSSALRSEVFGSGFALRLPVPLGLELRWHAPSMPLTLSIAASGEIESLDSYYFGGGVFASFRL
jgi:hypothetical protein